ncbi:DUF423 domain-containing protein [Stappia taiwanensis]|uniref:DUF423 domain-containing protein n=1 Tax=Stappia taiwanensis TaxID=992267 RepID=A0A838XNC2_9HYPH|nr:DUF423 domain-containing protein [Stappia taiwanensis]MBA4610258.1 DUF423 domain-containing protein [Stappia taiwanensis]GGE78091.1 hypothetical protein GCM10007285_02460 [Stappia taiwanensis]
MTIKRRSGVGFILGGLVGAGGVALSAAATHSAATELLRPAAQMLLFHAPLFLSLSLLFLWRGRGVSAAVLAMGTGALVVLVAGLALFCGDLLFRAYGGARLFPFAAPLGGSLLIAAWVGVILTGAALLRSGETERGA